MSTSTPIGLASRLSSERAAYMAWLQAADYKPVPVLDLHSLARELEREPFEALVADAELVSQVGVGTVVKILSSNRPLIVMGRLHACPAELRRVASWLDRPVSVDTLMMQIALSLAEGRPVRCSPRKSVLHLPATVNGVVSQVIDVSNEGVRLKLKDASQSIVPPFFTLRVEVFGVTALVKRAWVAAPGDRTLLCGGKIHGHLPKSKTWEHLVAMAPPPVVVNAS